MDEPKVSKDETADFELDLRGNLLAQSGLGKLRESLEIAFENLTYTVTVKAPAAKPARFRNPFAKDTVPKQILRSVSGMFSAGRTTAVMGASGAGKTSLLQVLAGEGNSGRVGGHIYVNGQEVFGHAMKKFSGFVFQEDVIMATQTVREAINMSAQLRLPKNVSAQERLERVEGLIRLFNLTKCANTVVGNSFIKGVSGGERKRTAIAMEMVTNPCILFLDEPTSGLDTFTAYSVVSTLKRLAHSGRTIVATIHQPSSETFLLFDDLLLMADGRVMYHGPVRGAIPYFTRIGYPCPLYTNPADFIFMALLTNETRKVNNPYSGMSDANESNKQRLDRLLAMWLQSPEQTELAKALAARSQAGISGTSIKVLAPFVHQFRYLARRVAQNAHRNPLVIRAKIGQSIFTGLVFGLLYLNTEDKLPNEQIQNWVGAIFFLAVNNVMTSCMSVLNVFAMERQVFIREHGAGYYKLSAYFLAKVLVEMPVFIIMPLISLLFVYWMAGFQASASKFFIAYASTLLCSINGFAMGIFFGCVFDNLVIALAAAPLVLVPLMMLSGFFVNQNTIPVYMNWIKYLSPMKYGFEALAKNQFDGLVWPATNTTNGVPVPTTGEQEIAILGLDDNLSIADCLGILTCMGFGFMLIAFFAMYRATSKSNRGLYFENDPRHQRVGAMALCAPQSAANAAVSPIGKETYKEAQMEREFLKKEVLASSPTATVPSMSQVEAPRSAGGSGGSDGSHTDYSPTSA